MAITMNTLFGEVDKVEKIIKELRALQKFNSTPICLKFSGGKDSTVIYDLAKEAKIDFHAQYDVTTVDPPELVYHIREHYPDVHINYPDTTMWKLIPKKMMPPTRVCRYCCSHFKEKGCKFAGGLILTGVRWKESKRRGKRSKYETCQSYKKQSFMHPVIDWEDSEIWEYIKGKGLPYCSLYDEGWDRIGCIACPMAKTEVRIKELKRYPKIEEAYIRAFDRMLKEIKLRKGDECKKWKCADDVMEWWLYPKKNPYISEGQIELFYGDYYEQFEPLDEPVEYSYA